MHLASRNELAFSKDLLKKPIAICCWFGFNHMSKECDTWMIIQVSILVVPRIDAVLTS